MSDAMTKSELHIYRPGEVKPQIERMSRKGADPWRLRDLLQGTPEQISLMYQGTLKAAYVNGGEHAANGAELRFNAFATTLYGKRVLGTLVIVAEPE